MTSPGIAPQNPAPATRAGVRGIVPGMAGAMVYGAVSFGLISTLAYSIWAFQWIRGTTAMYSSIAAVYIGLSGLALAGLVRPPHRWQRFPLVFAGAFLVYAIAWCAFWFGLRGRHLADLWGATVGLGGMTFVLQRYFGASGGFLPSFLVLLACHSAGYYAGGELYAAVGRSTGRILWGAAHGVGFGAGLGFALVHVQRASPRPTST